MSSTSTRRLFATLAATAALFSGAGACASDGTTAVLRASASGAAKEVYAYIATRPAAVNNNLILGQHLGGFNELPGGANDGYFSMLGHGVASAGNPPLTLYPGMVGTRYDANDKSKNGSPYVLDPDYDKSINAALVSIWQGYHSIVALTATPPNPWSRQSGRGTSASDQPLSTLLRTPANIANPSPGFTAFWADAATIADGLEELKNQGIPVVFRPFAEYNSGKYYGPPSPHIASMATPADFKALWADVWSYYVNDRHLNNLIFCWEAWVMNRSAVQADLASWFPDASTVDIVSGAYYFQHPDTAFPPPNYPLTLNATDTATHQNLLAVAENNNKPFGVAQWGLYYDPGQNCLDSPPGDAYDAVGFFNSVLSTSSGRKRTGFIYHWTMACAIEKQVHNSEFVSNPVVATTDEVAQVVSYLSDVNGSPDGWVQEDPAHLGYGLVAQTSPGPLYTGDTAQNVRYRSILTFDTVGIPAGATITSVTLRVRRSATTPNGNPFTLFGPMTVDIAASTGFGGSLGLSKEDFQQVPSGTTTPSDTINVGTLTDPALDHLGWSEASLSAAGTAKLNRAGVTQLRILFKAGSNNNGKDDYVSWYSGDTSTLDAADKPQLIVTYRY